PLGATLHFTFVVPRSTSVCTLSLHDALPISYPWPLSRDLRLASRWDSQNVSWWHRVPGLSRSSWPKTFPPTLLNVRQRPPLHRSDRKSTRLNSSHVKISYAVFCLKKKRWYGR